MLTDNDITKLKAVFATKQDLADMEKRLVSKEEFKKEIAELKASTVRKEDFSVTIENIAKESIDYINTSLTAMKNEIVTEIREDIDRLIKELRGILGNQEGRMRRLEDEVFPN